MRSAGSVRDVVLGGELVVEDGRLIRRGKGRFVFRRPCFTPNA